MYISVYSNVTCRDVVLILMCFFHQYHILKNDRGMGGGGQSQRAGGVSIAVHTCYTFGGGGVKSLTHSTVFHTLRVYLTDHYRRWVRHTQNDPEPLSRNVPSRRNTHPSRILLISPLTRSSSRWVGRIWGAFSSSIALCRHRFEKEIPPRSELYMYI